MSSDLSGIFETDNRRKICAITAGPYFDELLRSREIAHAYLRHPDPRARLGALLIIRDYWKPSPDFAQVCEKLIIEDDDPNVRCAALSTLGANYYGFLEARIGRMFAEIVRDEGQPQPCRYVAYLGLLAMKDLEVRQLDAKTFQPSRDVNWEYVESFFRTGE